MGNDEWRTANFSKSCNCDVCGREIFIPVVGYWTYKYRDYVGDGETKYFCGWNCMRKFEREYEEKKVKRANKRKKRREFVEY